MFYIFAFLNLTFAMIQMIHQAFYPGHNQEVFGLVTTTVVMHLLLGLTMVWLLKELNHMLKTVLKGTKADKNYLSISLATYTACAFILTAPAVVFIYLMYKKPQVYSYQTQIWHYSSKYVSLSVLILACAMILLTVVIYKNVDKMQ